MRPWLVTGASGQLGAYLLDALSQQSVLAWKGSRGQVDLRDRTALVREIRQVAPSVILHAAALARVGDCFRDPAQAHAVNTLATAVLAEEAAHLGTRLVYVSTDMVFDGEAAPYRETDPPRPISVYGRSKAEGERAVLCWPGHLVVRVSLLFGPSRAGRPSFFDEMVSCLREGKPVKLFHDEWRTPLDYQTAAHALVALAKGDQTGILHLGGPEKMSRLEMGQRLARLLGKSAAVLQGIGRQEVALSEPRPRDLSLDCSRWRTGYPEMPWPRYEEALRGLGLS